MFDLSSISSAKIKAEKNQEKNNDNFEQEYSEALALLNQFTNDRKQETLRRAANKFFSAIKCKRSKAEPYIYLSYIFHIFDQNESSIEYLNIAKSLDSNLAQITELQEIIYS